MVVVSEMKKLRMSQFVQWENVKFYRKSPSKTFQMIKQAYGKEALGCSAEFKWHKNCQHRTQDPRICIVGMCQQLPSNR
jgi:hypothetical protein